MKLDPQTLNQMAKYIIQQDDNALQSINVYKRISAPESYRTKVIENAILRFISNHNEKELTWKN